MPSAVEIERRKRLREGLGRAGGLRGTAGYGEEVSKLLGPQEKLGMRSAPATMERARRLSVAGRGQPGGLLSEAAPSPVPLEGQTSVKAEGWLEENKLLLSSMLGKAGQAIMGPYQETWQARLGGAAAEMAEGQAYQQTVSKLLAGEPIESIAAARVLSPPAFKEAMAAKTEADKVKFAETADEQRRQLAFDKYQLSLDKARAAGDITGAEYTRRLKIREEELELRRKGEARAVAEEERKVAAEERILTPERKIELKVDLEKKLRELGAPEKERDRMVSAASRVYTSLIAKEYSEEDAMSAVNTFLESFSGKKPIIEEGEEEPSTSYEAPQRVSSLEELMQAEEKNKAPGEFFYGLPDGKVVVVETDPKGKKKVSEQLPDGSREELRVKGAPKGAPVIFDFPKWIKGRRVKPEVEKAIGDLWKGFLKTTVEPLRR